MEKEEFNQYLKEEAEAIRIYSDKMTKKEGMTRTEAATDWIKKYAQKWRDDWNNKK